MHGYKPLNVSLVMSGHPSAGVEQCDFHLTDFVKLRVGMFAAVCQHVMILVKILQTNRHLIY